MALQLSIFELEEFAAYGFTLAGGSTVGPVNVKHRAGRGAALDDVISPALRNTPPARWTA